MQEQPKGIHRKQLAIETYQAASLQDMPTLYRLTKARAGKFQSLNLPVKDKIGNIISKRGIHPKTLERSFRKGF